MVSGCGEDGLVVELDDLIVLFQPWWLYDWFALHDAHFLKSTCIQQLHEAWPRGEAVGCSFEQLLAQEMPGCSKHHVWSCPGSSELKALEGLHWEHCEHLPARWSSVLLLDRVCLCVRLEGDVRGEGEATTVEPSLRCWPCVHHGRCHSGTGAPQHPCERLGCCL